MGFNANLHTLAALNEMNSRFKVPSLIFELCERLKLLYPCCKAFLDLNFSSPGYTVRFFSHFSYFITARSIKLERAEVLVYETDYRKGARKWLFLLASIFLIKTS